MATMLAKPCLLLVAAPARRCPPAFSLGCTGKARLHSAVRLADGQYLARRGVVARAGSDDSKNVKYRTGFGYSRKDVILIGVGLIGLGYALYYGLQAMGMEAGYAGNWVQLIIFLGICLGWVSSYIFRVATKQMTYVKQLEQYEEAVMQRRVEEMTEAELAQLAAEVEADRQRRGVKGAAAPGPKQD